METVAVETVVAAQAAETEVGLEATTAVGSVAAVLVAVATVVEASAAE